MDINQETVKSILKFISTVVISSGIIGVLLNNRFNKKLEDIKNINARALQTESFFRSVSGDKIEETFDSWTGFLLYIGTHKQVIGNAKNKNIKNAVKGKVDNQEKDLIMEMIQKLYIYGSPETVRYAAGMQQHLYSRNGVEPTLEQNYEFMLYVACIISSLKKDFTGYEVDPLDVMRLKITDYPKNEATFKKILEKIRKEVEGQYKN